MLVLTRKQGERIQIGDGIVVSVERIVGGRVQIGIEAPQAVRILREELLAVGGDDETGADHESR
jgi:carbon storage regulator